MAPASSSLSSQEPDPQSEKNQSAPSLDESYPAAHMKSGVYFSCADGIDRVNNGHNARDRHVHHEKLPKHRAAMVDELRHERLEKNQRLGIAAGNQYRLHKDSSISRRTRKRRFGR